MGEKIVVGPINKGLRNDVTAFVIDNDSFPNLINAYQWRGRVKRKRGTSLLGRLTRQIDTESIGVSGASPWTFNIFTVTATVPETNATIEPGSVRIYFNATTITGNLVTPGYSRATYLEVFSTPTGLSIDDQITISGVVVVPGTGDNNLNGDWIVGEVLASSFKIAVNSSTWGEWQSGGTWTHITGATKVFIDQGDGTLDPDPPDPPGPPTNFGTINYASGSITLTHTEGAGVPVSATFNYYPNLPVMGLEDFETSDSDFPGTIGFDTRYAYDISPLFPYPIHNVNFYKNPAVDATNLPGYVPKTVDTEFTWHGQDYQQFWTTNYQGALWATNGITIPFNISNIGMQYGIITGVTISAFGPPAIVNISIANHGLVIGDFVFINEIANTITPPTGMTGINFQTGYVIGTVVNVSITVELPNATVGGVYTSGGIAQYLTNTSDATRDVIRWYDGDPTIGPKGWVNFAPPLSQAPFSIADLPEAIYYLVGARMIQEFKDRLLFIGPVVQTSAAGSQKYLQDTVIFSQNGTPYYTTSYTNSPNPAVDTPASASNVFFPILLPANQTATSPAFFEDQTGFGGFISAGISQKINTVSSNEDVLIMGFDKLQASFSYTGNDIIPFNFYAVNSELGSSSTFSIINMDDGALSTGNRGFIIANQNAAKRIDLEIPDEVFHINLYDNGKERICAQRDYIQEWIYFTYPYKKRNDAEVQKNDKFPNQTLQYNYRDNSWAIFYETYTHYGQFRKRTGFTWATVGTVYATWGAWNVPWNSGSSNLLQPDVIAGNQQGFVMFRDESTDEATSLYIKDIVAGIVTSPNHGLNTGDYIIISGAIGTISSQVNGIIFSVNVLTIDTFSLNLPISTGTYTGGGLIKRLYVPFIQTKQFPVSWGMGRKTRIGVQQYLLTTTSKSQIQLLIYLSQNAAGAYNTGGIVPQTTAINKGLIYSTVLYTCTESANLGLTPANTNLQMISNINSAGDNASSPQAQIWHRVNTSLIGDTVQLGFTMSDAQMRAIDEEGRPINAIEEIELHSFLLDVTPSQMLS